MIGRGHNQRIDRFVLQQPPHIGQRPRRGASPFLDRLDRRRKQPLIDIAQRRDVGILEPGQQGGQQLAPPAQAHHGQVDLFIRRIAGPQVTGR